MVVNYPDDALRKKLSVLIALFALTTAGCASSAGMLDTDGHDKNTASQDRDGGGDSGRNSKSDARGHDGPGICGDGILTKDEACDDGNAIDGDGCAGNCRFVEVGFSCNPPGNACQKIVFCGDGALASSELCDDGNTADDDGCSSICKVEIGYKCEGEPSVCAATTCGDLVTEGTESCDDGNAMPFDGCSATCQAEPDCSQKRCISECGDGLLINEACDDGNTQDGDGCSSTCEVEDGFTCKQEKACDTVTDDDCVLKIYAVFRDFSSYGDPDGEFSGGGEMILGLVQSTLDAEGKPVAVTDVSTASNGSIVSQTSFARWYRDTADSETKVGVLNLYDNGNGGYVNRWGKAGEKWCFGVGAICFDGTPAFFPVDDLSDGGDFVGATIPEEYGGNWQPESAFVDNAAMHNFGFTTEVKYWFFYDETQSATLEFLGDDDMWVFVNGVLALDLGNIHMPEAGAVTIDAASAEKFGLVNGNVYPIQIFHAERNPTGSSFKLTLSGFDTSRSVCLPTCGDGVVGLGEECDDGVNDGGYGECAPGCVLGEYCGDGIVQDNEDCDDGNNVDKDDCPSACRHLIII